MPVYVFCSDCNKHLCRKCDYKLHVYANATSEEDEEWDYLKGIDMYTIKTTKKESRIGEQDRIIKGDKRSETLDKKPPRNPTYVEQMY